MTIQPIEAPADSKSDTGDKLRHIYCIKHGIPETGICGAPRNKDFSQLRPILSELEAPPNRCIVCEDLKMLPCTTCGA